ncbi:MAG: ribose 5-phosphate isomerase B [Candidatus Brocadia sp.]
MRIAIGSDHAGFELKENLAAFLRRQGYQVVDVGTYNKDPVDYPDFAEAVGLALHNGQADRGVLICCSGVGASVAATKIPGIRAGLCHDTYSAHQGVEHDDMNVLVLGSCVVGLELAKELVRAFAGAGFTGEERHRRRLEKIKALETRYIHLIASLRKEGNELPEKLSK